MADITKILNDGTGTTINCNDFVTVCLTPDNRLQFVQWDTLSPLGGEITGLTALDVSGNQLSVTWQSLSGFELATVNGCFNDGVSPSATGDSYFWTGGAANPPLSGQNMWNDNGTSTAVNSADSCWTLYFRDTNTQWGFYFDPFVQCFHGDNTAKKRNRLSNRTSKIKIKNIKTGDKIYSVSKQKYVPVRYNLQVPGVQHFYKLPSDNQNDLLLTKNHLIKIEEAEIPIDEHPFSEEMTFAEPQTAYNIITPHREAIWVDGNAVMTWSYYGWVNWLNRCSENERIQATRYINNKTTLTLEPKSLNIDLQLDKVEAEGPKDVIFTPNSCGTNNPSARTWLPYNHKIKINGQDFLAGDLINGNRIIHAPAFLKQRVKKLKNSLS